MDAVRLKNMRFFAHHGCSDEEAEKGGRFEVDVELTGDFSIAGHSDDLKDACDFDRIYMEVSEAVTGTRFRLIEALAEEICRRLLKSYPEMQVRVVVRKPHPPVKGVLDSAEVEIARGPLQDGRDSAG